MNESKNKVRSAVGQAIRAISRGKSIPPNNALLQSPLILQEMYESELEDTPENRQQTVETVLKRFVNEYGVEEVGTRQREAHEKTFTLLFDALKGRTSSLDTPARSLERYRPQGFAMLAEKLRRAEQALTTPGTDDTGAELALARSRAQEIMQYLQRNPVVIDLFALDELTEVGAIFDRHSYYGEAQRSFAQVVQRLKNAPHNNVMLRQHMVALRGLAHAVMNQNEPDRALYLFSDLSTLAQQLHDQETWTHGTHMQGVTANMIGNWRRALDAYDHILAEVARKDAYRVAWVQRDKITTLITKGDFSEVDTLARQSLAYRETLPHPQDYMMTLEAWVRALIAQGKYREAQDRLNEIRPLLDTAPLKLFHMIVATTATELYVSWGKRDRAAQDYRRAQKLGIQLQLWHQLQRLASIWQNGKG